MPRNSLRCLCALLFVSACAESEDGEEASEVGVEDLSVELQEDGSATVTLVASIDSDEPLQYEIVEPPTLGQLVGTGSIYEFVPNRDSYGVDQFTWRASSETSESEVAVVNVSILPVNDAPSGTPGELVTTEGTPVNGTLEATDIEDDPLTYLIMVQPGSGRLVLGGQGDFTYTPDADFVGGDTFTWTVQDDSGTSAGPVPFSITITASP